MIRHWKVHLRETLDPIHDAYRLGLENGDVENATSSLNLHCVYSYLAGEPIVYLLEKMAVYQEEINRFKQETNLNYFNITYQSLLNLAGNPKDPAILSGDAYDEDVQWQLHEKANDRTALCVFSINKMILLYLFGNYRKAVEFGAAAKKYQDSLLGLFLVPVLYFYYSLSLAMCCNNATKRTKKKYLQELGQNLKMFRMWAEKSPENHKHKADLIEAEMLRVLGKTIDANNMYNLAIQGARDNMFKQEEALSHELAAQIYIDIEDIDKAAEHIILAHELYWEWGALAKVRQLEKKYPHLFVPKAGGHSGSTETVNLQEQSFLPIPENETIDLYTVTSALQAISSEIILEKLIEKIMIIVVENAGAQKGVLFLHRDGEIFAEAECIAETGRVYFHSSILSSDFDSVPQSVVNYVKRTGEFVVLGNAAKDNLYAEDPYIQKNDSHSILCIPLIARQDFKGIIYLENRIAADVFNPKRLEVTRLLATQAAFSLENAILFDRSVKAEEELQEQYEEIQSQYEEMEALNQNLEQMQKELMESEERYRTLVETMNDGIIVLNDAWDITYVNRTICSMLGQDADTIIGKTLMDYLDEKNKDHFRKQMIMRRKGIIEPYELEFSTRDGKTVSTLISPQIITNGDGKYTGSFGVVTDITEKKNLERQLLQAQKMEAIGNLAGGIAHDFNNFLTAITGYSSLIISQIDGESEIADSAREILKAAERSASLTRQLLVFSRKQLLRTEMLNINNVIMDMENLLQRVIGEDIKMTTELHKDLEQVNGDRGQIEQTLMNIVVNARDAMPNGGQLVIKTNNLRLDQALADDLPGATPGRYVKIDIIDNGTGIQSDIIGKIFEPFFTTKAIGEGTGLGLSVVYGIVKQHGGNIYVTSNPTNGTTFTILFPESEKASSEKSIVNKIQKTALTGNNEKILLVEDQKEVSRFAELALARNGYQVYSSSTFSEAMDLYKKMNGDFDLIFSDVVLPDGTGPQLVEQIKQTGDDIRVILTSGYSDRKSQAETISEKGYSFLQKPYSLDDLLDMISSVLKDVPGE